MVTENGEFRYPPPLGEHDIPTRRRIPNPPRLDPLRIHPPGAPPRLPPPSTRSRSPRPNYSYSPPDDHILPPVSPQFGSGYDTPPTRPIYRDPAYSDPSYELNSGWRHKDSDYDRQSHRKAPRGRPGLRISMSTSRLNHRRPKLQNPYDRRPHDMGTHGLALPRFTPGGSEYGDEALRSSVNSAMTSQSSIEHASGTERSSVLTKSSSITDLSPDTPDGPEKDGGMSVEDAISMYLDGFSDVTEEPASPDLYEENKQRPVSPRPATAVTDFSIDHGHTSEEHSPDFNPSYDNPPVPSLPDLDESEDQALPELDHSMLEPTLPALTGSQTTPEQQPVEHTPVDETRPELPPPQLTPPQQKVEPKLPEPKSPSSGIDKQESKVILPGLVPPPLMKPTSTRDCYGFRKATTYVTVEQYEAWNGPYSHFAANRSAKWAELLKEHGLATAEPTAFPPKSSKIKRFVRKGIPSEYRGAAWFFYAGGYELLNRNLGLYDQLVQRAMVSPTNDDKEHIERDLHRTFPDNIHFKPEASDPGSSSGSSNLRHGSAVVETQMIQSLRRVLYAFALHNPKVGYTQSLNFITGMLLLFLPEEKAFWMLHIVTSSYLPGTHEISLEGANIDLWILMVLLRESLPNIYNKIGSAGPTGGRAKVPALTVHSRLPDITLGLTNWLMSVFIGTLPLETTLRVWDVFFYEGSKSFFRVSLAIFKACERDILRVSDPMEVFQVVQTVPKRLLDANSLLDDCFVRRHRVGQGRIEELRASRRAAVRQDKMRRSLAVSQGTLQAATDEWPTRARTPTPGTIADSWRQMKHHAFG
ncbi:hypothetical protein AWENTII_001446 [Aspergillus wentii]|nr:hypothetical protein MW887_001290 [Aspergillus wentii]